MYCTSKYFKHFVSFTCQQSLEEGEYGSDLETVQINLDLHHMEHQQVLGFRKEIDRCIQDRVSYD